MSPHNEIKSGSGWNETAWSSSGSGCSAIIAKPAWQTDTGCSKRTMSDIAFDGDPGTGAAVYQKSQGGWQVVGGTSMSAPAIAAIYALAGGTGVQSLYKAMGTPAIKDIVSGSNGRCSPSYVCNAGPGFDGPTGVGVPNGIAAFGP